MSKNKRAAYGETYRVVYGETMPSWERTFSSKYEAAKFSKLCEKIGDVVFYNGVASKGPRGAIVVMADRKTMMRAP